MGSVDLPQVEPRGTKSVDEYVRYLAEVVALLQDEIANILGGRLSSENVREIAGYNVSQTELKHKSGIVGMSGADPTNPNAIRFWAGDDITGNPKFVVTQAGILTAIAMILKSAVSGQNVTIDDTGLHAYDEAGIERLTIGSTTTKGVKAVTGRDETGTEQSIYVYGTENVDGADRTGQYITAHGAYILLDTSGNIRMQTDPTTNGEGFRARKLARPEINDGGGWASIAKKSEADARGFTLVYDSVTKDLSMKDRNGLTLSTVNLT